jgi:hypothetical protein
VKEDTIEKCTFLCGPGFHRGATVPEVKGLIREGKMAVPAACASLLAIDKIRELGLLKRGGATSDDLTDDDAAAAAAAASSAASFSSTAATAGDADEEEQIIDDEDGALPFLVNKALVSECLLFPLPLPLPFCLCVCEGGRGDYRGER